MKDNRDSIDFGKEPVGKIFRKMFLPTLVAMVTMVVLNITDGAFVGHGVGSDALAAVSIIAPVFLFIAGIGLMFGIGGSVVASIHLSKGKVKAARINITQSLIGGFLVGCILGGLIVAFQRETCLLFGSSEKLIPLAKSYLVWIASFMPLCIVSNVGMFMVRLDGSPRIAMYLNVTGAVLNMLGDGLLIYGLDIDFGFYHLVIPTFGLAGAAIATSFSYALTGLCTIGYLLFFSKTLQLYRLRMTMKSLRLTLRNLCYQIRIGESAMLGEIAISALIIVGNYQFIRYMGEDGVAAFSVACYMTPIAFMFGNAIVQSSQPIISFAHGRRNEKNFDHAQRIRQAMRIDIATAVLCGIGGTLVMIFGADILSSIFLPSGCKAWELCQKGLPLFGVSFVFVVLNLTMIGYYQSTEQASAATVFTLLRGFIILIPSFILMPLWFGTSGLWLSLGFSEMATFMIICANYLMKKRM